MPRLPISMFTNGKTLPWLVLFGLAANMVFCQTDSIHTTLAPVVITTVHEIPTAHTFLDSNIFHRNSDHSLEPAFVYVPGVRFESRGPGGSRRLTIRGSLLRSAFGVRGVKVYLDGLPITSPEGDTPLELLDPAMISTGEVFKGPQGALYGPGSGGIIQFHSQPVPKIGNAGGELGLSAGSFGYFRGRAGASFKLKREWIFSTLYVRQQLAGYRQQEGNAKDYLHLHVEKKVKNHQFKVTLLKYAGHWELPGALDDSVMNADPRAALPYSINAQAAVHRDWNRIAAHHTWQNGPVGVRSGIYGLTTSKENPYGTSPFFQGYKDENASGVGFRSEFWRTWTGSSSILRIKPVIEGQLQDSEQREFENNQGFPGQQRRSDKILSESGLAGLEMAILSKYGTLAASGGLNLLRYRIRDQFAADSIDFSHTFRFKPIPQYHLAYALGFHPWDKWFLQGTLGLSSGYSPPGLWEILHEDGSMNLQLGPETGTNLELGFVLNSRDPGILRLNLVGYHFWLNDVLLPTTDLSGMTRYENGAASIQRGIELAFESDILREKDHHPWTVALNSSMAIQDYLFVEGDTASLGNRLAGVPRWSSSLGLDIAWNKRTRLFLTYQGVGKIFLTNANHVFQKPYYLLNMRLETLFAGGNSRKTGEMRLFMGGNNLLNARYSNYLNLNDARSRYWNPAPSIHGYFGIELRL